MESLCGEEIEEKKAVFGRCVIVETNSRDSSRRWLVVEVPVPFPLHSGVNSVRKLSRELRSLNLFPN